MTTDTIKALQTQLERLNQWRIAHAVELAGTARYRRSTEAHRLLTDLIKKRGGTDKQREIVAERLAELLNAE